MYDSAEDYMKSIRGIKSSISNKESELKELKEIIAVTSSKYDLDKIRSSPKHDKLEQNIINNMERREMLQLRIEDDLTEMMERKDTAVSIINMIDSEDQKQVLMLRYIEGLSWAEIMEKRECDDIRNQYRLHQRALESIQKIIDSHLIATPISDNM